MKTLSSFALLAAVAALVVLPLSLEFAMSTLSVAGLVAVLTADYRKRQVGFRSSAVVTLTARPAAALRLAA